MCGERRLRARPEGGADHDFLGLVPSERLLGKLIYSALASLDGFGEDAEGKFDWAATSDEMHAFVNELERSVGTYLYGRRMYETMVYWESPEARDAQGETEFAEQRDLSDIVEPGRGLGAALMADHGVMEKVEELSGFPLVPGTLNVRLPTPLERGPSWRCVPAEDLAPRWEARTGQTGYFLAPVTVARRYRGLAFQAVELGGRGYPPDQIELFCEVRLRAALRLEHSDPIAIRLDDG